MLGISDEEIVTEGPRDAVPDYDADTAVELRFNQTNPLIIRDGIDRVSVIQESPDRYLVAYEGYLAGYLRITAEGAAQLGHTLLGDQKPIPDWVLISSPDTLPEWIPTDYEPPGPVRCEHCEEMIPVTEVYTLDEVLTLSLDYCCTDCWDELKDTRQNRSPDERAKALRDNVAADPETAEIQAVQEYLDAASPQAQAYALAALNEIIEVRPREVIDTVALHRFEEFLTSDDTAVCRAAISCLATLADSDPTHVTSYAATIIDRLSTEAKSTVQAAALRFVTTMADHHPEAVLDAVPTLAALLHEDTPHKQQVLVALTRIGDAYPDELLPVTDTLRSYVDDEDNPHRVAAIAALGYVTKAYPNVSESLVETLTELLDASSPQLRANAAGLLADIAGEYPARVRPAVDRASALLSDTDRNARYNATSILARIAKNDPAAVEPALGSLIDVLDDEFAPTRTNACWALGYLHADAARTHLREVADTDPDDDVREVAAWALQQISDDGETGSADGS